MINKFMDLWFLIKLYIYMNENIDSSIMFFNKDESDTVILSLLKIKPHFSIIKIMCNHKMFWETLCDTCYVK